MFRKKWTFKEAVVFALILATLAFIWGHSLIPATGSAKESMSIVTLINEFLSKINAPVRMQGDKVLRKIAHAGEYLVLGAEIAAFVRMRLGKIPIFACLHAGVWISVIDETIQLFVPGRYGQISDVWIDCAGFLAGSLIIWEIIRSGRSRVS